MRHFTGQHGKSIALNFIGNDLHKGEAASECKGLDSSLKVPKYELVLLATTRGSLIAISKWQQSFEQKAANHRPMRRFTSERS